MICKIAFVLVLMVCYSEAQQDSTGFTQDVNENLYNQAGVGRSSNIWQYVKDMDEIIDYPSTYPKGKPKNKESTCIYCSFIRFMRIKYFLVSYYGMEQNENHLKEYLSNCF